MGDLIERVARELEPQAWAALGIGDTLAYANRRKSATRKARAAIAIVLEECAQVAEYERLLDHTGEPDNSAHNYSIDRIAHNIRHALENLDTQREIERLAASSAEIT